MARKKGRERRPAAARSASSWESCFFSSDSSFASCAKGEIDPPRQPQRGQHSNLSLSLRLFASLFLSALWHGTSEDQGGVTDQGVRVRVRVSLVGNVQLTYRVVRKIRTML